ncbi:cytochrome c3 family protein [Sandarakinorhabdus oryzae]|uniref:cytochrome c3 family protein n=1 Tax=Sandarakinorhabdus oryzae TaxID=2675220 RepID=UPI0012E0CACC|nr:cytochrome c3 family protein [Sandarakinorhabdus oryzae]
MGWMLPAAAQSLVEKLVTPGPLSAAHAKLEANCSACHESFSRADQNGKCTACHKPVADDVRNRSGFHGKSNAGTQPCKTCHSDHHGRGFALVKFTPAGFNHQLTDYPLVGGHARATCAGCHPAGKRHRDTPTACATCHAKTDPHRGQLGQACQSCHVVATWKTRLPFDHSSTRFALTGAHRAATCQACHAGERWKATPTQCVACHAKDDAHKGSLGPACATCHTAASWKATNFDHDHDTRFALLGKHASTSCAACHGVANAIPKPPKTCIGCHAKQDVHKGRNGSDCARCHNNRDWKQSNFNHDTMTRFVLKGAHRPLECQACHKQPPRIVALPVTCIGCHAADDPHRNRLGPECGSCHNEIGWKDHVVFDHGLTRFPLLGKHAPLACTSCHADKGFAAKGLACQACHDDRHHAGTLGPALACATCHGVNDWKLWRFDHDRATQFALTGRHKGLICTACHSRPGDPAKTPTACVDCHRQNDVHRGNFGNVCERCHVTSNFSEIKFDILRK